MTKRKHMILLPNHKMSVWKQEESWLQENMNMEGVSIKHLDRRRLMTDNPSVDWSRSYTEGVGCDRRRLDEIYIVTIIWNEMFLYWSRVH